MCNEEFRRDLLRRAERELGKALQLHYALRNDVVVLCLRQIEYGELSSSTLKEKLAVLPEDAQAREAEIERLVREVCQRAASSRYVRDCERVARFLHAQTNVEDRKEIANEYQAEYAEWAYGVKCQRGTNRPAGCLGARLIAYLGEKEAANRFAEGQEMLDERVFCLEGFAKCVAGYQPKLGKRLESFFKQFISWRAGDVSRRLKMQPPPGRTWAPTGAVSLDNLLEGNISSPDEEGPSRLVSTFQECLEQLRRQHRDPAMAALQIAAFELRYKAYLDPTSMSGSTRQLVTSQLAGLQAEFLECQQNLRTLEEDTLPKAEHACDVAWRDVESSRGALEIDGCSAGEMECLERQAVQRSKKEMEEEWQSLSPTARRGPAGLRVQYAVCWKALALARGRWEQKRKQWEKWLACRKPWVRSEKEIGQLLGEISQPTTSRYLKAAKDVMHTCMDGKLDQCE